MAGENRFTVSKRARAASAAALPGAPLLFALLMAASWLPGTPSGELISAATPGAAGLRFVEAHAQRLALVHLAVETGDGGACLVPFHFHEREAAAAAREDVFRDVHGAHLPERGEKLLDRLFRCLLGKAADKHFLHIKPSEKNEPRRAGFAVDGIRRGLSSE